ncbi:urease accessory UreF family protein [Gilvimarinus sp. SDUM040013]|uniref:Urease accessory protein UreF n=1 Tax=Gilvimarinus gilvus TaxID=3058038 RepID=A0ABU4S278_9GAMM|nr:urease accessory UreF family protein [Gilvimarinus sp. SDUM040013]MDO3388824.1 urease accessory UreF family protein [Gilvimarinus sp. SDUM040013]MDX6850577.1 urease accessory UreF family protein [Gilvimarinus sp. SDUM040013]
MLHLMHLVSPALPVGAYAYSQGLEYAIDAGWLSEPGDLEDWMLSLMQRSLVHLDIPMLHRFYRAWEACDIAEINRLNDYLRACRETRELLLEDEQLGVALGRLLQSLGVDQAKPSLYRATPSFTCQFALAGVHWSIGANDLAEGFVWSWLENQVAAATKIVPLGQTQAQKILVALLPHIPALCEKARGIDDDSIGLSLPGVALASSLHERQYSRLFRS